MMLSKKIATILFGSYDTLVGGTPLRANLTFPKLDGSMKTFYWEGNKGIITILLEKIENLEAEVLELKKKDKQYEKD